MASLLASPTPLASGALDSPQWEVRGPMGSATPSEHNITTKVQTNILHIGDKLKKQLEDVIDALKAIAGKIMITRKHLNKVIEL